MEDTTKKGPEEPEDEGLLDKAKKLIDKADDFIEEKVEQVKQSKPFESVAEALDKAGDYVEDKVEDIKNAGIKEKLEAFADKTGDAVEEKVSKAKEAGKKLANKAADKLDDIAENLRKRAKDEKTTEEEPPEA